jgi:hypothetical protein
MIHFFILCLLFAAGVSYLTRAGEAGVSGNNEPLLDSKGSFAKEEKRISGWKMDYDRVDEPRDGEPVHCVQEIGNWSTCVPSNGVCGKGTQTRTTRIIQQPNAYGNECRSEFEEQSCIVACPSRATMDGNSDCVATVGEFGKCSSICGPGKKTRQVNVIRRPSGFGLACPAVAVDCNEHDCTEDDIYEHRDNGDGDREREPGNQDCVSRTTEWSPCSEQVCGSGRQHTTHVVDIPARGAGKECSGIGERVYRTCYAQESGSNEQADSGRWMCERTPILVGVDLGIKTNARESSCAEACDAETSCIGFSYANGTCNLKSETSDWTAGQMFYTRMKDSGEPFSVDTSQACTNISGYDCMQTPVYSGKDDTNYVGKTVQECKKMCSGRSDCVGFSRGSDGRCWLKNDKVDVSNNKRFYRKNP